jgi:hypothetical protein
MSMKAGWESEASMPSLMWPHLRHPREVAAMVEEQARHWTLRQYGRWEAVAGRWPVVTISRESGNQSHALGRSLAERLGFSYWDRGLVVELVRLLGLGGTAISMAEEGTRSAIEDFLGDSVPEPTGVSMDYVERVRLVLDSIVYRGGAVLVGQGAQFLVAARDALRVRLVIPMALRHPLAGGLGAPADFDVVVNAGTYERERAVGLVLMAYLAKFGDWPTTARRLLNGRRTGLVSLLPAAASGLTDERRVQHKRDLRSGTANG